ncbi:hypothetical protein B0H34DRAFT_804389 [Crassisporium funariophilum]|nr:hypothetical protein B0H34DRAFT_804389 [Crassisporium funariophilum]
MSSSLSCPSSGLPSSFPFSSSIALSNVSPKAATALTNVVGNLLRETINNGPSLKRTATDVDDEEKENGGRDDLYMTYGRQYARSGDIFASIDDVIQFGVARAILDSDDERELTPIELQCKASWELCALGYPSSALRWSHLLINGVFVVALPERCCHLLFCAHFCNPFSWISEGIHNVCAEDASSLKAVILDYLLLDTKAHLNPLIKQKGKKADWGFQHPVTANLLCPLKYDASQRTYSNILAGKKSLTAYDFPRFLYPDGHVYNPDDMEAGILHGHLLICVAKHNFQGPTAALERPGYHCGQRGNAALMGMITMTPRAIAYVAVQTQFAISAVDTWAPDEGNFNYNTFFWALIGLFNDGEGEDIIKLYNKHVFGPTSATEGEADVDGPPEGSDLACLKAQCQAKRARVDGAL